MTNLVIFLATSMAPVNGGRTGWSGHENCQSSCNLHNPSCYLTHLTTCSKQLGSQITMMHPPITRLLATSLWIGSCLLFGMGWHSTTMALSSSSSSKPYFSFGVIADIQYAPVPNGYSYTGVPRYYSHARDVAAHAAKHFQQEQVPLVVNLGDIIDGKCQEIARNGGLPFDHNVHVGTACTHHVLQALKSYKAGKMLHIYGNHELYNLNRKQIGHLLDIPFVQEDDGSLVGYFSYLAYPNNKTKNNNNNNNNDDDEEPNNGIRFVVIDSYDVTLLGHAPSSPKRIKAEAILAANNPNYPHQENSPEGLQGLQRRFVGFNGAVDQPQLTWLRETLTRARDDQVPCVILSHQPIHPGTSHATCLMWNYHKVLELLREFKDIILLSLAGHAHQGGYQRDESSGIHFRVVEAVLETPPPNTTYSMVDVYRDKLVVKGFGDCESAEYDLSHITTTSLLHMASVS
jgi:manganese-dependent ADP-ribose/CDP-alcohol diphosphatase